MSAESAQEKRNDPRVGRYQRLSKKLGVDLYARFPRKLLHYLMDIRPPDWKQKKWRPVHSDDERVFACVLYYSWCYPVCMEYAVQIDTDDEIMHDRYGKPMMMTQEAIAKILNMDQPRVCRVLMRLRLRKVLEVEDRKMCPIACPMITIDERHQVSMEVERQKYELPPAVLHRLQKKLDRVGAPKNVRTYIFEQAKEVRTAFLEVIRNARHTETAGYKKIEFTLDDLIVQTPQTSEPMHRAPSPTEKEPSAPTAWQISPTPTLPVEEDGESRIDQLFEAVTRMQAAYPRTEFGSQPISRDNSGDRKFLRMLEGALQGSEVLGFELHVAAQFKGLGRDALANLPPRSPDRPRGPRSLGLLIEWAKDYARGRARGTGTG
jgi:hypothetical protein